MKRTAVWLINLLITATLLMAVAAARADDAPSFVIQGQKKTCQDTAELDQATAREDASYFAHWTDADFHAGIAWSNACPVPDNEIRAGGILPTMQRTMRIMSFQKIYAKAREQAAPTNYAGPYHVHGVDRTCGDIHALDIADLYNPNEQYFAGWDRHDFDTAAAWIEGCKSTGQNFESADRPQHLRDMENKLLVTIPFQYRGSKTGPFVGYGESEFVIEETPFLFQCETVASSQIPPGVADPDDFKSFFGFSPGAEFVQHLGEAIDNCVSDGLVRADDAAQLKAVAASSLQAKESKDAADVAHAETDHSVADAANQRQADAIAAAQQQEQEDCQNGNAHALYAAASSIVGDRETIATEKANIAHEKEIGRVSGYVNTTQLYASGSNIIDAQNDMKENWAKYKKLGGKAKSPQAISDKLTDPCSTQ